ncbi:dipicolinate synthase subunit B [Ruminococcus sp. NK3A76]|uniref:dipicolinate synthase subunit B n=1 Tax=Ruminococcus sp. NK3A76 TaxID=877411 RepID=UPI00048C2CC8|nr:dipicolinate synthase subunit B [Ruminococcus sp. NK3A76]
MNEKIRVGFALTGSFCTFDKAFAAAQGLVDSGFDVIPIMSFNAAGMDTRFGKAEDHIKRLEAMTGRQVIRTIADAEPIGPKRLLDVLVVAPCTANTAAKLALGITDTPVTMAVKSHVRNALPVVIAISTNDALSNAAKNIGLLQSMKNYYFVPYRQDNYSAKPNSIVADLSQTEAAVSAALQGRQLQPLVISPLGK